MRILEAAYVGNIGMMELVKFHRSATPEQKQKLQQHVKNKNNSEAWKLVQQVTGMKLHKSVQEQRQAPHPDILGKNQPQGAGNDGTDDLVQSYTKDTPGQQQKKLKSFKQFTNK